MPGAVWNTFNIFLFLSIHILSTLMFWVVLYCFQAFGFGFFFYIYIFCSEFIAVTCEGFGSLEATPQLLTVEPLYAGFKNASALWNQSVGFWGYKSSQSCKCVWTHHSIWTSKCSIKTFKWKFGEFSTCLPYCKKFLFFTCYNSFF